MSGLRLHRRRALSTRRGRRSSSFTARAHDHSVWALQSRYFAHHGATCSRSTLPGHGRSGGDACERRCERSPTGSSRCSMRWRSTRAAFVGHSLGALAVLDAGGALSGARVANRAARPVGADAGGGRAARRRARRTITLAFELITSWSFSAERISSAAANSSGRLDERQRAAPDGALAAGRCSHRPPRLPRLRRWTECEPRRVRCPRW